MRPVGALVLLLALFGASCGGSGDDGDSAATSSAAVTSTAAVTPSTTPLTPALTGECATAVETLVNGIRSTLDRVDDAPAGSVSVKDEVDGILASMNDGFGIDGCESLGSQRPPYTAVVAGLMEEEQQRSGASREITSALLTEFCHGDLNGVLSSEGRDACAARG